MIKVDNALGVPAVWAAVNFISGTLASLLLEVHRKTDTDHDKSSIMLNSNQPYSGWPLRMSTPIIFLILASVMASSASV